VTGGCRVFFRWSRKKRGTDYSVRIEMTCQKGRNPNGAGEEEGRVPGKFRRPWLSKKGELGGKRRGVEKVNVSRWENASRHSFLYMPRLGLLGKRFIISQRGDRALFTAKAGRKKYHKASLLGEGAALCPAHKRP